ncbi:MAG: nucleotidyltransferase domain-containing protein [Oscillospiraceae bacterium]|nr:nucleotidyltransferase domain-containing protein [Oscillospiraceae bacterium]
MLMKHKELLDTLLETIKAKYADEISIMIIYGSCVNGTFHEKSDLDMIYIPKTDKGWKLARTFILDGIGYDVWGADWKRLEQFANFDDMKVSILADSQLVFYATDDDKQRYESLKNKALSIANGPLSKDLLEKARRHLNTATQYYGELCLEFNLTAAGGILMELYDTICLLNHTYLRFGMKRIIEELSMLNKLPEDFISTLEDVVRKPETKANYVKLLKSTERLLSDLERELSPPAYNISGLYEEISSTWNKIRISCAEGDAVKAFMEATSLQHTLDCVQKEDFDVFIEELRFFDSFDSTNLKELSSKASKAEASFVKLLLSKGVPIASYKNIEQLKQALD